MSPIPWRPFQFNIEAIRTTRGFTLAAVAPRPGRGFVPSFGVSPRRAAGYARHATLLNHARGDRRISPYGVLLCRTTRRIRSAFRYGPLLGVPSRPRKPSYLKRPNSLDLWPILL